MSAEAAIYALLAGAGPVTAVVGDRIYPAVLPEGKGVPAIVYEQVSSFRPGAIDAYAPTHLTRTRVQVGFIGPDYAVLKTLRDAIRNAVQFQRGPALGGGTVHTILFNGEGPDTFDADLQLFHQSMDFFVTHEA